MLYAWYFDKSDYRFDCMSTKSCFAFILYLRLCKEIDYDDYFGGGPLGLGGCFIITFWTFYFDYFYDEDPLEDDELKLSGELLEELPEELLEELQDDSLPSLDRFLFSAIFSRTGILLSTNT